MLKFLFIIILFLIISRGLRRLFFPSRFRKSGTFTYRSSFNQSRPGSGPLKKNLDQIEDADFEEIKDKNTNKE